MKTNISYEESIQILTHLKVSEMGIEKVIFSNSLNRVLGEDIFAQENMPPYATSAMDGYAFNSQDLDLLKTQGLKIDSINRAGEEEFLQCPRGSCIKTFTGARIPKDCDSLVLIENIKENNGVIYLSPHSPEPKAWQWIRQKGENYTKGERLLKKGTRIGAFEIALLAELNCVFVPVFLRPRIAILSGGDEIIEVGEEKRENTFRSVNNHLLSAIAQEWGATPYLFPLLKDDKEEIRKEILQALKYCDILITTGGASKGDFDFVQEVLKEECQMQFKGVRMKPGKPVGFGIYQNQTYVFGLPGFPNSCAVTFMLFVRNILEKMYAMPNQPVPTLKAKLTQAIKRTDSRKEFRICDLNIVKGRYEVGFWNKKTLQSSVINNFCQSSAIICLEENGGNLDEGAEVDMIPLLHLLNL